MGGKALIIDELSIRFGARPVVANLSLHLEPGKAIALVGESGAGKSVTARSLVGLAGAGATVQARRLHYGERDLLALSEREWRRVRGKDIGFVLQDALGSLDPLRPVGKEILEALAAHGWGDRRSRWARVIELLEWVGVPDPQFRARQRSDELSGGLRQRALIASALALNPGLIIADEPTTALDATVQAQILGLLRQIKAHGNSLLLISHDLAVVAHLADEVLVLRQGEVVERGPMEEILRAPQHPYTQALLDALPAEHPRGTRLSPERRAAPIARLSPERRAAAIARRVPDADGQWLLEASRLGKRYRGPDHQWRQAIEDVSFTLEAGRTLGIVGESGSGKTTVARIVLGLLQPDSGSVRFSGRAWNGAADAAVSERQRQPWRREISVIYQDPLSSFDPRWNVRQILEDALQAGGFSGAERDERLAHLLQQVRLSADIAGRRPLHLSGGQRQRVAIARAIASRPRLIVCDEPVSALDVSVQAQVLDLLADLQDELGVSYLFISHDLGVVRHVSDEVLVMYQGRVVERGSARQIFETPQHSYTKRLLAAAPRLMGAERERNRELPGAVPASAGLAPKTPQEELPSQPQRRHVLETRT
jgi:peptide/nickel transport system ATP-binding protein